MNSHDRKTLHVTATTAYIAGQWREATGEAFLSRDPATGDSVWEGLSASAQDVSSAVEAARASQSSWASLPLEDREAILERFAKLVEANSAPLARYISLEVGKPLWESATEVASMVAKIPNSIKAHRERCACVEEEAAGSGSRLSYKPHGVLAVFGPFNLPGHLPNSHIVPALLAGNTVVYKPSEQAPAVAERIMHIWEEAGLPPGVINLVQGGRGTGEALAGHPGIDGLCFTGGAPTGHALHKAFAGRPEKILALEMGGNNPLIAWDVHDADAAAYSIIQSAFITSGQRCVCARRLILPVGKRGDDLVVRLVERIRGIRMGACTQVPEPFMGPVISESAASALMEAQESMVDRGARILAPMAQDGPRGTFLSPGLLDVTHVKNRGDEELFGPLLQVTHTTSFEKAIEEANRTRFGLSAGILSDRKELFEQFLLRSRAGIVNWNRPMTGASGAMPFGGVGASGNHRPSAYFAADYCSFPVSTLYQEKLILPGQSLAGLPW